MPETACDPPRACARRRVARGLAALTAGLEWSGAAVLAGLFVVVFGAVVQRYVFGSGLLWSDELAVWLNVALVAIGAPLAASGGLAMRLDVVVRLLPEPGRRLAAIVADAVIVQAGLVLAFGAIEVGRRVGGVSTVLGLPEWLRFAAFGLGGGLTVAVAVASAFVARGPVVAAAVLALGGAGHAATHVAGLPAMATPSLAAAAVAGLGLLIGAPLPHALIVGAAAAIPLGALVSEPAIVQQTVAATAKFLLLAIPFFLLAGAFLTAGGLAERLVRFAAALVGHRRAGLAQTALVAGVFFSGASGSSVANAAFGAKVMAPALVANGYPRPQAAAIVAAVSMLDNIIPPSIAFLILASATNLSVGALLVGGFVAGGVLAAALALGIAVSVGDGLPRQPRATAAERTAAFAGALPAIGLGVVVVVGIRFGVVTTTEASALAVAYALAVCLGLGGLDRRSVARGFRTAAAEAAAVGLLIGASAPFAVLLAVDRVADDVGRLVGALGGGPFAVMLLANLLLLLAGLFLDIGAAILLMAPLMLPAAVAAGIDPIHFGVILVVNLMIHGLTPPLGILVYVVAGVTGTPAGRVFRAVVPLLTALLAALALLSLAAAAWPLLAPNIRGVSP